MQNTLVYIHRLIIVHPSVSPSSWNIEPEAIWSRTPFELNPYVSGHVSESL